MSGIKGWPSQQKLLGNELVKAQNEFATVVPTNSSRHALDTTPRFAYRVGSQSVARTAGATTGNPLDKHLGTFIEDTATPAILGDFARFEDGSAEGLEIPIVKVETNGFYLSVRFDGDLVQFLPASGDEFFILRYATQRLNQDGSSVVVLAPPAPAEPVEFSAYDIAASGNITNAAYTEMVASLADDVTEVEVFNSSGCSMYLAIGAAAAESDLMLIPPNGFLRQGVSIAQGQRVSVKALFNDTDGAGEILINFFG